MRLEQIVRPHVLIPERSRPPFRHDLARLGRSQRSTDRGTSAWGGHRALPGKARSPPIADLPRGSIRLNLTTGPAT